MPIEEQLLPNVKLKPYYDKVTWLYVCRTFKNDAKDREAARTHDRFGVSSWPQMFVFDPRDDRVLQEAPRDLRGFMAALDRSLGAVPDPGPQGRALHAALQAATKDGDFAALRRIAAGRDPFDGWREARERLRAGQPQRPLADRLADADPRERALALEDLAADPRQGTAAMAARALAMLAEETDVVVRIRALAVAAAVAPERIAARLPALLAIENDTMTYAVIKAMAGVPAAGRTACAAALERLYRAAGEGTRRSRNPNVVRIRAAEALGRIGGPTAVDVLAPTARAANPRNGLTRTVLRALAELGGRADEDLRRRVLEVLAGSLPGAVPTDTANEKAELRVRLALARDVLRAIAGLAGGVAMPAVPTTFDAAARGALARELRTRLGLR